MAITVQRQFTSAVTEIYQDACVGSSIDNGTTFIPFELRQHDFHQELGTQATLCWRTESSHVDVHALSTFHNPMLYRFIVAQGASLTNQHQRVYFTPEIQGVSTSQPMSHSVIRWACYLAVVCRVSLRHMALLLSVLFLMPLTKSSIKRWIDDIGSHLPTPEQLLQQLLALTSATACHMDGYSTCSNKQVGACLSEVTQFVRPMSSLFAPQIVSRVVVATMQRQMKQVGPQVSSDGIRLMPPGAQY
jgi:hypothetical protein